MIDFGDCRHIQSICGFSFYANVFDGLKVLSHTFGVDLFQSRGFRKKFVHRCHYFQPDQWQEQNVLVQFTYGQNRTGRVLLAWDEAEVVYELSFSLWLVKLKGENQFLRAGTFLISINSISHSHLRIFGKD